jgi:hypothetical protein
MTETRINSFNIEPLVFEIENVIKNGLKVLLKDYIDRHDLLEKTHKQIMKLPSVMNEINKGCESDSDSEDDKVEDKSMFDSITDMTRDLVKKEISYVESKLDRIEKKYESISPLISKILDKLESINDEVKVLKEKPSESIKIVQMEPEKLYSNIIKPSIVSACENENIKFEINEDEYEESDEDDINPALITCSTISIKQEVKSEKKDDDESEEDEVEVVEPVKVKKEVIVIEEDDEEEEVEEEEEEEYTEEEIAYNKIDDVMFNKKCLNTDMKKNVKLVEEDEVETEASDEEDEVEEEEEEVVVPPALTKVEVEEEDEAELEIITIDDIDYCTNDLENGFIWELSEDGEQGDKIGYLKEGEPFFYADEN